MHHFFSSLFSLFLSPWGALILSALDSTVLFFLAAAIDTAVVVMSARDPDMFWIYMILAFAGTAVTIVQMIRKAR